jgi:hypothetical protein
MSRYELVAIDLEAPDGEGEELIATGSRQRMEAELADALAEAQEDYDDGRYPWRALRVQPA